MSSSLQSSPAALADSIPDAPRVTAEPADRRLVSSRSLAKPQIGYQLLMLLCALAVLSAAALLRLDPAGSVEMPGSSRALPAFCVWRQMLGINCPGCGLTRAFVALAHGQWKAAWNYNAAAPFFFALLLYQVPFRGMQLARLRQGRPIYAHSSLLIALIAWTAVAALMLQWAWRMM